mgnify:FL=1
MNSIEAILGSESIGRLRRTDGIASALPGAAYTSDEFLELEFEHVFKPSWTFVGFGHDIPCAGDTTLATVAGVPLILVRTANGQVNAFHNVCRHRGLKLVSEPCQGKQHFVCPNHGWTYDLDGCLINTPHFGGHRQSSIEGFNIHESGLKQVRCAEWHHWLLVNLDGKASSIESHLASLKRHLEHYDLDSLVHVKRIFSDEIEANWKLIIENYMEPYHVPFVHKATTQGQPLQNHACITDGNCVGSYVRVDNPIPDSKTDEISVTEAPNSLDTSAHYLDVFPNFGISTFRDALISVLMVPLSPGRTHWQLDLYFYGHIAAEAKVVNNWADLMHRVFLEDKDMIERLQLGRASPVTDDGGFLSPVWETCIRHLHLLVIDAIEKGERQQARTMGA